MQHLFHALPSILKSLIAGLLLFILVLSPLPFGSRSVWGWSTISIIVFLASFLFFFSSFFQKKPLKLSVSFNFTWVLIILWIVIFLQLLPLPIALYKYLSPARYDILIHTLPNTLAWYPLSFLPAQTFQYFIQYSGYILFYILTFRLLCSNTKIVQSLALLVSLIGLFEALYGLLENLSGNQSIFGYKNFNPVICQLTNVATGTFINPNHYGNYLSLCFFVTMGLIGFEFSKNKVEGLGWKERLLQLTSESSAKAFFLMGVCSIIALAIFFSGSRGALINLIVGSICFIFLVCQKFRSPWKYIIFIPMIFIAFLLFLLWVKKWSFVNEWFIMMKDILHGESFRFCIWEDTLTLFLEFPLFGAGADVFESIYPLYQSIPNVHIEYAHNDYVQALAEYGIFAFLPMVYCILRVHRYLKALRKNEFHPHYYIAFGAFAACFSFLLHCIFEFNFHIPSNIFVFLTALAISALPLRLTSELQKSATSKRNRTIYFQKWAQLLVMIFSVCSIFFCYRISKADWCLFRIKQGHGRDAGGEIIELSPESTENLLHQALHYDKNNPKILYHKARFLQKTYRLKMNVSTKEYFEKVNKYLLLAQKLDPLNSNIHLHMSQLYKKLALYYEKFGMREETKKFKRKATAELKAAKRLAPALSGIQNKKS